MVYTITLNPALDRTLWLEKIQPDESNRIEKEQRYAGGKRIDVSKVLTTIGMSNRTLGFVGVHPEIYRKIIEIAKNKEAKVILYTDGDALKVGIQGLPDIIKPNVYELSHLVGVELKGKDEIINAARDIREQGIGIVLTRLNGS